MPRPCGNMTDKVDMEFSVRRAKAADIPQMCALLSELFSIESDFIPDHEKQEKGLNLLLKDRSGSAIVFVAEKNDQIIGMCSLQTLISTAEGGTAGLVEDLIVRKEHRGKGIGTKLLSKIQSWCLKKNISRIQLLRDSDNAEALNFYNANGWSNTRLRCMRKFL
jgi:GNAT superfamily N-acetyltransferase